MKKIGVLFICLFLLLSFTQLLNVQAQDIGDGLEDLEEQFQEGVDKVEDAKEILVEGKWDYLGKEWKEILLKNKFVSSIDNFLTKISIVFVILFGEAYSLSLTLLFVIMLWFYFFFKFSEIFTDYSSFSSTVAIGIGLLCTIIFAQLKVLRQIIEFFGWLAFSQESNIWRFLIMLGIFLALMGIYYLSSKFGDGVKKSKEKSEKEKEEMEKKRAKVDRGILRKLVESIMRGLGVATHNVSKSKVEVSKKVEIEAPKKAMSGFNDAIKEMKGAKDGGELNKIYRRASKKFHPDTGGSHEAFIKLGKEKEKIGGAFKKK